MSYYGQRSKNLTKDNTTNQKDFKEPSTV